MSVLGRVATATVVAGAAGFGYGSLIERNLFTLRRFTVPILEPGSDPLTVLHVSDLHITPQQRRKQRWIAALADLQPDLVVNTGDTISAPDAIPAILDTLRPLAQFPAVFVPGNNDYYAPKPRSPFGYFTPKEKVTRRPDMPWDRLAGAMVEQGWTDLTHVRTVLAAGGRTVALAGTDDPYLKRAHYDLIAGPRDVADVGIGVIHSPEPPLLSRFADDGYQLLLAGHTHGGQVRIPFGPAIVTNCGIDVHRARWLHRWDDQMWFNVCAGLGTNPYMPLRFACRPEATLLTLVARPS
ncbi:MAG: metallophosphoesterase [Jatrophihabitans sp.]